MKAIMPEPSATSPVDPQERCRTCLHPISFETREESGFKPREGWYDGCDGDPLVCFAAIEYRHVPLRDRERAYYDAGWRAALGEKVGR